ncbi:MAG: c-type cytochrome [Geminicoccaceae bacterium]
MKPVIIATLGIVAFGAASVSVQAADDPISKAVEARQAFMKVVAFNLGALGAMAKGEMEYDPEMAAAHANNLASLSEMKNGAMWPQGSDNATLGEDKTRALPVIWESYPKVAEKHEAWSKASVELAASAGDGIDALKSNIGAVGKSCGGCHDDFRAEKK